MLHGFAKATTLALLLLFTIALGTSIVAQQGPQGGGLPAQARDLNNQLLAALARVANLPPGENPASISSQADSAIGQRAAVLEALMDENPKEVLGLAFSSELLAQLSAAFPSSARDLESNGVWEGAMEVTVEDSANLFTHKTRYRMRDAAGQALNIHFEGEPDYQSGDVVRVRGVRVRSEIAAADGGAFTGTTVAAASMCSPLGAQKSIVLLVNMQGTAPQPITTEAVRAMFFGTTGRSVSGYWQENSHGKTWAEGDVKGWYTLDASYSCDQYLAIRDAAIRAADRDVDFSQYNRVFLVMSGIGSCSYAGLGDVGCGSTIHTGEGAFTVSTAWMQSNYFDDHSQGVQLSTHEGGHNLGLGHAASRDFGNEALGAPGVAGTYSEYGDNFSAMGFWNFGHYAAPHKVKLGWLTNYLTVTGNGSFAVQPMEFDGNLQALKIQRGTDSSKFIWMEYRQSNGLYDSALNSQVFGGGLVHYQDATIYKTNLLDFTPATATFSDAVLAGKWTDPYTSLTIEASNPTSSSLNVNVYYGSVPCVTSPPSVTLSPLNPSGYEGGNVNYTVTVTNNDTSSCDPRSFTMSSLIPGSWPTTFTQGVLSIPAASRASTGMTKTIPEGTSAATYSVDAVAASSENSATASANLTVMPVPPPPPPPAPLSITVTATPLRNSVTISSRTTQGTLPVSGATVVFTMIAPNGASTRKATTDSSGNASWNFKVNPKTVKGSYMVTAQATLGSQTATSAAATFVVQ